MSHYGMAFSPHFSVLKRKQGQPGILINEDFMKQQLWFLILLVLDLGRWVCKTLSNIEVILSLKNKRPPTHNLVQKIIWKASI